MFKYIKYTRIETADTVLEFRGGSEEVEVFYFDGNIVSISSEDESYIDKLVASQPTEIQCLEMTKDEFRSAVADTRQLECIRNLVASDIAKKYTLADEIALSKQADTDAKKIAYSEYVAQCVARGSLDKERIGY